MNFKNNAETILKRIEDHKGRKLDLTNHRDLFRFQQAINSEFDKLQNQLNNIHNVLNGESTFDQTRYKVIKDSNSRHWD